MPDRTASPKALPTSITPASFNRRACPQPGCENGGHREPQTDCKTQIQEGLATDGAPMDTDEETFRIGAAPVANLVSTSILNGPGDPPMWNLDKTLFLRRTPQHRRGSSQQLFASSFATSRLRGFFRCRRVPRSSPQSVNVRLRPSPWRAAPSTAAHRRGRPRRRTWPSTPSRHPVSPLARLWLSTRSAFMSYRCQPPGSSLRHHQFPLPVADAAVAFVFPEIDAVGAVGMPPAAAERGCCDLPAMVRRV